MIFEAFKFCCPLVLVHARVGQSFSNAHGEPMYMHILVVRQGRSDKRLICSELSSIISLLQGIFRANFAISVMACENVNTGRLK